MTGKDMSTKAVLTRARERIRDIGRWCQDSHFMTFEGDLFGLYADVDLERAHACCADGAIIVECGGADGNPVYDAASKILHSASLELFGFGVVSVNDDPTIGPEAAHQRVIKIFDRAIEVAS